jgi:hypothetical protein
MHYRATARMPFWILLTMILTVEYYFADPQDKLGMYASDPEDNSHEHSHEFAELVIVDEGTAYILLTAGHYIFSRATFFMFSLGMYIIMMSLEH